MPITYQQAFAATNESLTDTQRDESARRIMAGVAANDAYWDSRSELEALRAQAEGHGVVVRGPDEEGQDPTVVGGAGVSGTVEGTATEENATALESGETASTAESGGATGTPAQAVPPNPDNPTEAVARLRAQVQGLGGVPEA